MRGLWVNTWIASQPISSARSIAFQMPPADETWAPNSMRLRYGIVATAETTISWRARLGASAHSQAALLGDDDHDDRRPDRGNCARLRSAYDALGSFVLVPVGMALAGPVSAAIGIDETLWLSIVVFLAATAIIVSIPSVRSIRAAGPAAAAPTIRAA